ncbi:MAG TPA: LytR C-terminal domain-containing protein [Solirubrobacteraceae bacterium]
MLNGTTVTGLARSVANRIEEQGFTTVAVTDASNQAQSDTKVEYGAGHRDEARDVARSLRIPADQVVAASDVDSTTAGPNAEVVVVVGQNFAR